MVDQRNTPPENDPTYVQGTNDPRYSQGPVQPPYYPSQIQATNGMAVASMVLGIVWLGWVGSLLAIIFGHAALKQIAKRGDGGKGMAKAGLVLGYVGAGTFALYILFLVLVVAGSA